VFKALVRAGHSGLSAGDIARKLGLPPSSLSFHLSHLRNEGLVQDERQGRSIIYRANFPAMESLVRYLFEECCADGCDLTARGAKKGIEA
jgi:DNA-binding transcriptional ArsR family regulator